MEKIIEMLQAIDSDRKHIHKHDLVCALGAIGGLLNLKIDKIEATEFNPLIGIGELGFYKEYEHGKLVRSRIVKLKKFCYLENEYIFHIGHEKSNETLRISTACYPLHEWDHHKTTITKN